MASPKRPPGRPAQMRPHRNAATLAATLSLPLGRQDSTTPERIPLMPDVGARHSNDRHHGRNANARRASRRAIEALVMLGLFLSGTVLARAACEFEPQGEGRVAAIIDGRTVRMEDGREVRLAGIELLSAGPGGLTTLIGGRDVVLRYPNDMPDRYGRQPAFIFLPDAAHSVQRDLLAAGQAVASATVADAGCAMELSVAEAEARTGGRGLWADPVAIKNAERPGDILAEMGRFAVVEGKVLSARQAGATFYVNFGRRWTRDFAVTISRRMMPLFEAAGIDLRSLTNKRIRVRGWVGRHGGPRIQATHVGQIELVADDRTATAASKDK